MDISSMSMTENLSKAIAIEVDQVKGGNGSGYLSLLHKCREAQHLAAAAAALPEAWLHGLQRTEMARTT